MSRKILTRLLWLTLSASLYSAPAFTAEMPELKPDKGLVVFYRSSSFKGGAIQMNIRSSEGSAGILTSGTMFHHYYEPGQRTFDVNTPSIAGSDLLTVDIEAGKPYFVRGEILMGWPAGRPRLILEQESRGKQDIEKL